MVKFISLILMVFFLVSSTSSASKRNYSGVCYEIVSRRQYRRITYRQSFRNFYGCKQFINKTKLVWNKVRVQQQICCPGYVNTNGICKPQCSPACVNGYCEEPNICKCNYGWGFDRCNETFVCVVAAETMEVKPVGFEVAETASKDPLFEQTAYACLPDCKNEVNNPGLNFTRTANMTYYFFPIESQCNSVGETTYSINLSKYGYATGAVIGVLVFAMLLIYVVRKKRKTLNNSKDIPMHNSFDYMEENTFYSGADAVL